MHNSTASTSEHFRKEDGSAKKVDETEERAEQPQPLIQFTCCVCGMKEKCRYGNIKVSGRTHSYRYKEEVYYLMDPFRNRAKIDEKRLSGRSRSDPRGVAPRQENESSRAPNILDFLVIGALCAICGQSVCLDELCSVFYSKTFCSICVMKECTHFPIEIVQQIELARTRRQRREAERNSDMKVPLVEEDNYGS